MADGATAMDEDHLMLPLPSILSRLTPAATERRAFSSEILGCDMQMRRNSDASVTMRALRSFGLMGGYSSKSVF
jgi:hypothetical protein